MQKKNRANTLFYAENNPLLSAISPGIFWLVIVAINLIQWRRGLMSSIDAVSVICLMVAPVLIMWFAARQQIVFASDHLRSVMGFFKKRVRYVNIAAISLVDLAGEHIFLSFELFEPRYSPVKDIPIPRTDCREVLLILAQQAPQAQWSDLARQWRDNTTE